MSERPYFSSSIDDLESKFKAHADELDILSQLERELSFRSTKRAQRLRASLIQRLAVLKPRTVQLPSQFEGVTLSKVAAELQEKCSDGLPREIEIDFEKLEFIRPAGVVFLSNLVHWLNENGTRVSFANINVGSEPIKYLDDSLFFEQHQGKKIRDDARPRVTTRCPYRKSNPYVLMMQSTKDGTHLDAPSALNEPSNRRILT